MNNIHQLLQDSIEDFAISRSERKELKAALTAISGQKTEQAKVRQMAFKMATSIISEIGEPAAMDWLQAVIKLLYANENEIKSNAYFSPGDDCLNRIRRLIAEAQRTLDICVFTITDNRIVERIEQAAKRGVKVRIISDDLKSEDLGSDLERLKQAGIPCLYDITDAHMHHKFAIADNTTLLTGSYNWTRSANTVNNENIITSNHPKLIKKFGLEFDRLWTLLS